jgi:hypothetical protein
MENHKDHVLLHTHSMDSPDGSSKQSDAASENDSFLHHKRDGPVTPIIPSSQVSDATKLHRSAYVLVLVLLYSGAAIFAWTVTCILSF